jgi:Rrf2 family protein
MLSKASEYAIRSLVCVAIKNRDNQRPGYREIAREIEAPEQFTAKILQSLVRQGMLQSVRGRGGGFFFAPDSPPLTLIEVINSVEGYKLLPDAALVSANALMQNPVPFIINTPLFATSTSNWPPTPP